MRQMIKTINATLSIINITILSIIVLCVTWQVVARFIFKAPSVITDELSRLLFICLGLLGGAYTAGQHRHLAIDLLPMSLTGKPKKILFMIIQTLIITFSLLIMVYGGGTLAIDTFESGQTSPALSWKMGYIYLCIPISGILIIIYTISLVMEEYRDSVQTTGTINK